jgi:hypothetical protein
MYFRKQPYFDPYYQTQFMHSNYYPGNYPYQFGYHGSYYPQAPFPPTHFGQMQSLPPPIPNSQNQGVNSSLGVFGAQDGTFDFQKAVSQFDQLMKTANQISPIVKQLGSLFTIKK